jgi:purine nucleosidase
MSTACRFRAAIVCVLLLVVADSAVAQRRKVIVDQDARGPATTDIQSILVFLQSPEVDVLGITLTSGDQWVTEETLHTLRVVEIAGRTDVPVVPGAKYSLLHTTEEAQWWESQYGQFRRPYSLRLRPPDAIPELPEGKPTTKPLEEHAANFIVRMVRKYPNEVTVWAGGPLTNVALALKLDPEIASLAKELVLMGSGFDVTDGGLQQGNSRREFNWWWDPEAVRIALSAPWKKITITPIDISVKTRLSDDIKAEIAKADTPVARYLTQFSRGSYMWDEISAIAFLDPSIMTRSQELYVNIDIDHGPSYGQTIFVDKDVPVPSWWKLATVQWDLDTARFYKAYIDLMKRPVPAR